jgi:hypothetical protein
LNIWTLTADRIDVLRFEQQHVSKSHVRDGVKDRVNRVIVRGGLGLPAARRCGWSPPATLVTPNMWHKIEGAVTIGLSTLPLSQPQKGFAIDRAVHRVHRLPPIVFGFSETRQGCMVAAA